MVNNENNPQQPGIPNGVMLNQMMQQPFNSLQMNQMAGMQWNGSGAPQMQPNFPMFPNSYPAMGGMPQQFLNPFPQQFGSPMIPQYFHPPGQIPMMPSTDQLIMMMMRDQVPQMAQNPFMQPVPQYTPSFPQPAFCVSPYPVNAPRPLPLPLKKEEVVNDQDSIVECTPDSAPQPKISIANILNEGEIKNEPIDVEDAKLPNTISNLSPNLPVTTSDSLIPLKTFPSPCLPTGSKTREEIPDSPASPDNQYNDQEGEQHPQTMPSQSVLSKPVAPSIMPPSQTDSSPHEELQENVVGCDEYVRQSPRRPSIPKRFPVPRNELIGNIDRINKPRGEGTSPSRMTKSPMRRGRRDDREESPDRKKRRVNAYSVLVDGVPPTMEEEQIEGYFSDRYGKCRVDRVYGDLTRVRIEFKSRRVRDHAYSHRTVFISTHKLSIHEDFNNERSESRDEAGPSRDCRRHSPIRVDSNEDIEMMGDDIQLERYEMECERGYPRKENLLTAGPIPRECNITSVIKYFRREASATIFDVPYPTLRPHEYLILRFSDISDAKRTLAQQEHIVDGHDIPVSPPCDVYLQLNGLTGLEREAMMTIQAECGVLINYPIVHRGTTYRGVTNMFGYVTFGRPQDAQEAISIESFNVNGLFFRVANSDRNYSFRPFKELWEVKSKLAEISKNEKKKMMKKGETNSIKDALITDYHIPILTIGPIPDHCIKECDQYLLSNFNDVHKIPFEMKDRNFRIVTIDDAHTMGEMLSEGYVRVGKNEERVLVSPSFDVIFKSKVSASLDMKQLIPYLQRKYGPIVRRPYLKHFMVRLTFGRIKDALKAIDDSPHFKSMVVIGEPAVPNLSYQHFKKSMNLQLHLDRANEADRLEEAANIRVDCRMNEENPRKGERRHCVLGQNSSETLDEKEKEGVLVCSPVKKNDNPEERSVRVRVWDDDQWLPLKDALLQHFQQFGNVTAVNFSNHLEGVIQFSNIEERTVALNSKFTQIGGDWISILPYSMTDNQ